jgi:hypothetical protein
MASHWNYRVVHIPGDEPWYAILEVHYDAEHTPDRWSARSVAPGGESVTELRADLERMLAALDKPVVEERQNRLHERE